MIKELNYHFSHEEHPLILTQLLMHKKDENDADDEEIICFGCQKQITDSESYNCIPCNFFLHKRCAELPRQIRHPIHSQHPLILLKQPPYETCVCDECDRGWKFFTYHCSWCEFDLDVSCAMRDSNFEIEIVEDRISKHKCHEHELVFQQRPAIFFCDACYTDYRRDASYVCTTCPFWIHRGCALLPETVNFKYHNHSLLLAYCLPPEHREFRQRCADCHSTILWNMWVYYCSPCRYFVHVYCTISPDTKSDGEDGNDAVSNDEEQNLITLPVAHAPQEMINRFLVKEIPCSSSTHESGFRIKQVPENVQHFYHEHPLTLGNILQIQDEIGTGTGEETTLLLCDGCIEPICNSDIYYACVECNYFLHEACTKLPSTIQTPKHPQHQLKLGRPYSSANFAKCSVCQLNCNSFSYSCEPCEIEFCIKCASSSLAASINHNAHKQHILTQFENSNPADPTRCNACGFERNNFVFACKDCKFYLDYECALMPPTTRQRWDDHLLILRYPYYFDHPEEFHYCFICERPMNPNCWMYYCSECDYSYHPWCFPRFGKFRNLKFGQIVKVDKHCHSLTHVQEADYKSFCAECNRSLDWEIAFECKVCNFYLCPYCSWAKESQM